MAAGYFGGYSAKLQDTGFMELKKMQKALERSHAKLTTHGTRQQEFNKSSRRLLKDLEAKGMVRAAVETTDLALHADIKDKTRAERVRTFLTVSFPVAELLSREERKQHEARISDHQNSSQPQQKSRASLTHL